jgi:hypothetical protein
MIKSPLRTSSYMRVWYRGFTIRSEKTLLDGKLNRFIVARIFNESIST